MHNRNTKTRSRNNCCRGKAISITYCKCVKVACVTQHAMRMSRFMFPSVAGLALPNFSKLPHKRYDFHNINCMF